MTDGTSGPITSLTAPQEQHMLLLFLPLKAGFLTESLSAISEIAAVTRSAEASADPGPDNRAATGVHFFMFYTLAAGKEPQPKLPVPSFQTAEGKDLLVVMSIYDADFAPYISAFAPLADKLNGLLGLLDESGIVDNDDPTSAYFIINNGGVAAQTVAFFSLLMRYNFADPTIPAAAAFPVNTPANPKYILGSTFPGLTVGSILGNYPQATSLYPWPPTQINFAPSQPPPSVG